MPTALRQPILIGPEDHGRRMSLDRFDRAVAREGKRYELNKGVIEVTDIPAPSHLAQMQCVREQLVCYSVFCPRAIFAVAGSGESKVLVASAQSERHPDLSVYLSAPPDVEDVWSLWVPKIVVEVVSPSSARRDYHDKPHEYLAFGVAEYWIVDAQKRQMTAMVRWRGQWKTKVLKASQKYTTSQLPGFSLDLGRVMGAGRS